MILIDPRAGSNELTAPLTLAGLPCIETTLEFGDLAFIGRGEQGVQVNIGIEHKKLPDLVQSLTDDRLAGHQAPGMLITYDRSYLIIEGEWDVDSGGNVVVPTRIKGRATRLKGCPPASILQQRVLTLEHRAGLRVRWTRSQQETIRYVSALYRFWTDRDLDEHRSHLALHAPDLDRAVLAPVSDKRRIAAMLPGVGVQKSEAVDRHFQSMEEMVCADTSEWQQIDGIGKTLAARIVAFCRGRDNE